MRLSMATQTRSPGAGASKPAPKTPAAKKTSPKASASKSTKSAASRAAPKSAAPKPGEQTVKRFDGKSSNEPLAIAFLMEQHREVEGYFKAYERAEQDQEKAELSHKICVALKVHAQIEEELFYPEAHEKLSDEDLVDEAIVEHASAKDLIAQIEAMSVGEHLYDAKVKVLGEYIKHHVCEEETEMFPEARKTDMNLVDIGERLQARSEELKARFEAGEAASRPRGGGLFGLFRESRP
jgi:hypothetical protein